jgi:hypothetical protein
MKSTWLREDSLFMPVAAVVRVLLAHLRRVLSCDMPLATSEESRGSLLSPATYTVQMEQAAAAAAAAAAALFIGVVVTREDGQCWKNVSDAIVVIVVSWEMGGDGVHEAIRGRIGDHLDSSRLKRYLERHCFSSVARKAHGCCAPRRQKVARLLIVELHNVHRERACPPLLAKCHGALKYLLHSSRNNSLSTVGALFVDV